MSQAPNLGRLLCRSKSRSEKLWKELHRLPLSFKSILIYESKRVKKIFLLKNSFNCEISNLIYVVIYQGCKE